jgi:uncharacterized repeat protein (TIGR02543 family)
MKKFLSLFLFLSFIFLLVACNGVEEPLESITVTFESNSETRLHPLTYTRGESVDFPVLESVGGLIFSGWFFDEALTNPVNNLEDREENFTVYAKWAYETYDMIIDMYHQITPKQVFMNDIALFIIDDNGDLHIQANQENPLTVEEMLWVESTTQSGFVDPDADKDNSVFTWSYNAFMVQSNGNVYAWGDNRYGQLGTADKVSSNHFIDITSYFDLEIDETIIKFAGNNRTTFALTSHGNVYAWGTNTYNMISETETSYALISPRNLNDFWCGETEHFIKDNGLCGETEHFIIDIVVTDNNVMMLTNFHNVFLWGDDANHWFNEIELMNENITEAVYMYFEGHITHMVASSNTIVLASENNELLILGDKKLGTGKDHAWGGGPVKIHLPDYLDDDDDGDGIPTVHELYLVGDTLLIRLSDNTLWGIGDNSTRLMGGKKGYDYYKSLSEVHLNFDLDSVAHSSQEVCALDNEPTLWCWGKGSSKSLSSNSELVLDTIYKSINYLGDETNWQGTLESEDNLQAYAGPIKWMAPESLIEAPFAQSYQLVTVARYYISAIPPKLHGLEITAREIVESLCNAHYDDCDDSDTTVHPDAYDIYLASNGNVRWTKETRENQMLRSDE